MEFWITQLFNGISYGALLFLLAGGLSLIFGMMRIVNMTHGSYYLLGGYVGLTVIWQTGSFLLAVLAGAVVIALLGVGEWSVFLRRLALQRRLYFASVSSCSHLLPDAQQSTEAEQVPAVLAGIGDNDQLPGHLLIRVTTP